MIHGKFIGKPLVQFCSNPTDLVVPEEPEE